MQPLGFHITMRLRCSAVLAAEATAQRRLALALLKAARPFELLAFRAADDHLHLLTSASREDAGELARRVQIALVNTLRPPSGFQPAWLEPVVDGRHLRRAFLYVLRQDQKHGFAHDPFAEASNLPDLLGLRVPGIWTAALVRRRLPRVGRPDLLPLIGAPDLDERELDFAALAEASLAQATLAATAGADLRSRDPLQVQARAAAVRLAEGKLGTAALAAALGITARTVQRLREQPVEPRVLKAVEGQLRLRAESPEPAAFEAVDD